jgi:hypothetical protein
MGSPRGALFFEGNGMWKIGLAFVVFAGLALYILSKGGDIDMSGEKHGETPHAEAPAALPAASPASAPSSAASSAK